MSTTTIRRTELMLAALFPPDPADDGSADTPFDLAVHSARTDIVHDILSGMKGRTFGIDYTTVDGRKRRMLAQIVRLEDEFAVVREINLTQRARKDAMSGFRSMGFTTELTDTEKKHLTEYRTIRYDGVDEIRVAHQRYNISALFSPVTR